MSEPRPRSRVLVVTDDRLGPALAGPAIRASALARELAPFAEVTLVSLQPVDAAYVAPAGVTVIHRPGFGLRGLARQADVVITGGMVLAQHPLLVRTGAHLVLDCYAPLLLEDLAQLAEHGVLGGLAHAQHRALVDWQMARADYMLVASERQRDYYFGRLCALGRLGPQRHAEDPSGEKLLGLVPFGLEAQPPVPGPARLRGVVPGLGENDVIFLWGGGLWQWLDPLTPIRAMAEIKDRAPHARLVFWAGKSPNPTTPVMPVAAAARALAAELGVLDVSVFFYEAWVPYAERGSVLLEVDAGISAHGTQLESRFAFRTRVLDYLWAGLPLIGSTGDALGDMIDSRGLGLACRPGSVVDWATAFTRLATEPELREATRARVVAAAPGFSWAAAVAPLVAYVEAPWRSQPAPVWPTWALKGPGGKVAKAARVLGHEGPRGLLDRLKRVWARRV